MKRVVAWFLLAGFVLLLVNIVFIHLYMVQSLTIYAIVALTYWFLLRKDFNSKKKESQE
jgi:asparagine N-glycosylation enzyme membrane subunit Stt3